MTTHDSSTAAALAFQAEVASAKARRDRDQPRHSPARPTPADPAPATGAHVQAGGGNDKAA